jgi:hypothetical protein
MCGRVRGSIVMEKREGLRRIVVGGGREEMQFVSLYHHF